MSILKVHEFSTGAMLGLLTKAGERIKYVGEVPDIEELAKDSKVRTINGRGRTLMSGLGDVSIPMGKILP